MLLKSSFVISKDLVHSFQLHLPQQFWVAFHKCLDVDWRGQLADAIRDVNRVEVAGLQEAVHGLQGDVIGIAKILLLPM